MGAAHTTPHQPEQIILQPVAPGRIQFQWVGNGNYCSAFDWASMRCTGYIHRQHDSFHGHTWFCERVAFDVDGHKWRHDFHAVVDDFGDLVEVAS